MDLDRLTLRERQVLLAVATTGTMAGAAKELGVTVQTIKNLALSARRKTGAVSSAQLIYWLTAEGPILDD